MKSIRCAALAVATAALIGATAGTAFAAVIPMDADELAARADSIVLVKVTDQRPRPGKGSKGVERAGVVTDTRLRVTKVLKGSKPSQIVLAQPGGTLGNRRLVVSELPQFEVGERCLVFLNAQGGVVGGYQGKLEVAGRQVPALGISLKELERRIERTEAGGAPIAAPALALSPATGAAPLSVTPLETVAAAEGSELQVGVAAAVTTLLNETFESAPTGWSLATSNGTGFGRTTYRAQAGTGSLYGAQSTHAAPGPIPASVYTEYTRTSPVSLAGYNLANFECDVYSAMTNHAHNWFNVEFSDTPSGGTWYMPTGGFVQGNTGGWTHLNIDLRSVNDEWGQGTKDFTGGNVYVRLVFYHQAGTSDEGIYVDNVRVTAESANVPEITSVTPPGRNAGIGEFVTITGADFGAAQGTGAVEFRDGSYMDGTAVASPQITSWSDTQIVCEVPQYAQSGAVVVTDANGRASAGYDYTVGFSAGGPRATSYPVQYRINENTSDLSGEGAAIQAAFPTWNGAGSRFSLAYAGTTTAATNPPSSVNYVNEVYFSTTGFTDSGILAWNYYWFMGDEIVDSNIVFNDNHQWANGAVSGAFDIQTVALHELGHTVGLDDQYAEMNKVMGAGAQNSTRRALSSAEVAGAIYLHGTGDTTPPSAPAVSSATHPTQTSWYASGAPSLSFSATDAGGVAGYSYVLDQSASTTPDTVSEGAATSRSYSGLASGVHYFHVRAVDAAGNWGPTTHYTLRVDTAAPVTSCPQNGTLSNAPVLVQLNATDSHAGVASVLYGIDGPASLPYTGAFTVTGHGVHTVYYRATDAAGNVEATKTATIEIDAVAPVTTATSPSGWVPTATVTLTRDDPSATTSYRVGAAAWATYSAPVVVTSEGTRTVQYFSADVAGNVEATRSATVRVDRTAPVVSSDAVASYNESATVRLNASDALSGVGSVEYNLDGAGWVAGTSMSTSSLGAHTLQVRATDGAGNVSIPVSWGFTVQSALARFEETDSRIVFDGGWSKPGSGTKSGGAWAYTYAPGSAAYFTFTGTTAGLITSKGPAYGIISVSVDGTATQNVDLYAASSQHQQRVWSASGLSDGVHVVKVEWTGSKNAASTKPDFGIDAFETNGAIRQSVVRYEQADSRIAYTGTWAPVTSSYRSAGGWAYTYTPDSAAYVSFKGTAIDFITSKASAYGIVKVTLDGGAPTYVDLYAPGSAHQLKVFSASGLSADTTHTLALQWTGTKNVASSKPDFGIDAFDVTGALVQASAPNPFPNRFEQSDSRIVFDGTWAQPASNLRSGSSWAYTYSPGSVANIAFDGTAVALVSSKSAAYGIAKVTLDGGTPTYVDLYSASSRHQQRVFTAAGLAPGAHTLTVEWTGTKNAASTKPDFGIDALETDGTLVQASSSMAAKTRFETTDARIAWQGTWSEMPSTTKSGGSWAYTYTAGARAHFAFDGTAVDLLSSTGAAYGIVRVTLDGGSPVLIDLYSAKTLHQQRVWGATGLAPGRHDLTVEWTGTKNPSSGKADFGIDAVDVAGTLVTP